MKIWQGYGTEHSMNLVMIGHFEEVAKAEASKADIERLAEQVRDDMNNDRMRLGWDHEPRFSDEILKLLGELKLELMGPRDVENFAYEYSLALEGSRLVVSTDEVDVAGFMKVMLYYGAKVEVYSGHHHDHGLVAGEG